MEYMSLHDKTCQYGLYNTQNASAARNEPAAGVASAHDHCLDPSSGSNNAASRQFYEWQVSYDVHSMKYYFFNTATKQYSWRVPPSFLFNDGQLFPATFNLNTAQESSCIQLQCDGQRGSTSKAISMDPGMNAIRNINHACDRMHRPIVLDGMARMVCLNAAVFHSESHSCRVCGIHIQHGTIDPAKCASTGNWWWDGATHYVTQYNSNNSREAYTKYTVHDPYCCYCAKNRNWQGYIQDGCSHCKQRGHQWDQRLTKDTLAWEQRLWKRRFKEEGMRAPRCRCGTTVDSQSKDASACMGNYLGDASYDNFGLSRLETERGVLTLSNQTPMGESLRTMNRIKEHSSEQEGMVELEDMGDANDIRAKDMLQAAGNTYLFDGDVCYRCCNCAKDRGWNHYDRNACSKCRAKQRRHMQWRKAEEKRQRKEHCMRLQQERDHLVNIQRLCYGCGVIAQPEIRDDESRFDFVNHRIRSNYVYDRMGRPVVLDGLTRQSSKCSNVNRFADAVRLTSHTLILRSDTLNPRPVYVHSPFTHSLQSSPVHTQHVSSCTHIIS